MTTQEHIEDFLREDNINEPKFLANYEILKSGTKEIYQAVVRLHSGVDISADATETIGWMALFYNQPMGYQKWFMAAYPDVVKWLSDLEEDKIVSIVGDLTPDDIDDTDHINLPILRKMVDAYKKDNKLECSVL